MLARWAMLCARRRGVVLLLWALLLAVSLPLAADVTHNLSSSGFEDPQSRAVWADNQLAHVQSAGEPTLLVAGPATARVRALAQAQGIALEDVRAVAAHQTLIVPASPFPDGSLAHLRADLRGIGAGVRDVDQVSVGQQVLADARETLARACRTLCRWCSCSCCSSSAPWRRRRCRSPSRASGPAWPWRSSTSSKTR